MASPVDISPVLADVAVGAFAPAETDGAYRMYAVAPADFFLLAPARRARRSEPWLLEAIVSLGGCLHKRREG